MNTALRASPPTESTQRDPSERDLFIQLPRQEELGNLSLVQRVALRVALRLIARSRPTSQDQACSALARARRLRLLQEYEAARLAQAHTRQVL